MCDEDRTFFQCDVSTCNLIEYCYTYMMGLRTYVVKEPINNFDAARKKFLLLRAVYYPVLILHYSVLGSMIYFLLHLTGVTYYLSMIIRQCLYLYSSFWLNDRWIIGRALSFIIERKRALFIIWKSTFIKCGFCHVTHCHLERVQRIQKGNPEGVNKTQRP